MDRLPAVIGCALALAACDDKKSGTGEPPSRVNGAKTTARQGATTEAFCDVHASDSTGRALTWPPLAAGAKPPASSGGWRWVNVWATYCKPCIEEMPRLLAWRDKLAAKGTRVELAFLSMDETDGDVAAYRKLHPEVPDGPRIVELEKGAAWFRELGLQGEAPIPVHVFVSPAGKVRCARAGGVREQDYAVVEKLFAE
jgi:thiol-disulfide isomerase/thioredoxin